MPGREQLRRRLCLQGAPLVFEQLQRNTGVQLGVIDLAAPESAVLVMLDQVVVRITRKGQGAEAEGIHLRKLQQLQAGHGGLEMGDVEGDEIVTQQNVRPLCKVVQP